VLFSGRRRDVHVIELSQAHEGIACPLRTPKDLGVLVVPGDHLQRLTDGRGRPVRLVVAVGSLVPGVVHHHHRELCALPGMALLEERMVAFSERVDHRVLDRQPLVCRGVFQWLWAVLLTVEDPVGYGEPVLNGRELVVPLEVPAGEVDAQRRERVVVVDDGLIGLPLSQRLGTVVPLVQHALQRQTQDEVRQIEALLVGEGAALLEQVPGDGHLVGPGIAEVVVIPREPSLVDGLVRPVVLEQRDEHVMGGL